MTIYPLNYHFCWYLFS